MTRPCSSIEKKSIAVLGATGSIGSSTLEIIRENPERFDVVGLAAGGNYKHLAQLIDEFSPQLAALAREDIRLSDHVSSPGTQCIQGDSAAAELAAHDSVDIVVVGIVGFAGLSAVLAAIEAGKIVALANKESLVCGGMLVQEALARNPEARLIPVDSEHSALYQALQGERRSDVRSFILTASGGPFLRAAIEELHEITPTQAVRHPRWNMGAKISVDSATLMNKALELIEACWLFDVEEKDVQVLIHPQSIVHSLVEFVDGTQIAQLSVPDMKGAIAYALSLDQGRIPGVMEALALDRVGSLEFERPDSKKFPALDLAREVIRIGGVLPAVFNLANEYAVHKFLGSEGLKFTQIVPLVQRVTSHFSGTAYRSLAELHLIKEQVDAFCEESFHAMLNRSEAEASLGSRGTN